MKNIPWNTGWTVTPGITDPFSAIFGSGPQAKPVTLPQDAMVLEPRDPNEKNGTQSGFYPAQSYTYEKRFFVPEDWTAKHSLLQFQGVMSRTMVYLNGELAAVNDYGYSQFYVDLDKFLRPGQENELKVLALQAPQGSRWYPGSGIYREVRLYQGGMVCVGPEDVRLTTLSVDGYATVLADVALHNLGRSREKVMVRLTLTAPDGRETACQNVATLLPGDKASAHMRLYVDDPALWSPESPSLCTYKAELLDSASPEGPALDVVEGRFGIRTLAVDARGGLRLNGKEVKLRGACIHHDNGIIGATTLPDAEEFRIRGLKEAGFNAIRSAHHPAGMALLDACDRLGVLVMDELTDMWEQPKNSGDYSPDFVREWRDTITRMVSKDYNHPSVIMYSLGNEIPEIGRSSGGRRTREMANLFRRLDPQRYVTACFNGFLAMADHVEEMTAQMAQAQEAAQQEAAGSEALNAAMSKMEYQRMDAFSTSQGLSQALEEASCELDIVGYNYLTARHEYEHTIHPDRVVVGSETYPPEIARLWPIVERNAHVIGDFTWTGYDYLGEAGIAIFHYQPERREQGWYPDRLAYCGDINLNAYRRPVSYLREIAYGLRKEPFIAVERLNRYGQQDNTNDWKYVDAVDSWTWTGWEGKPTAVHVLSPSQEVELFLDGRSQGRKPSGVGAGYDAVFEMDYQPGELVAVGYTQGREDGRFSLRTAGSPAKIALTASKTEWKADPLSCAFVAADLTDDAGTPNRWEARAVTVSVEGPAVLAGFGSAGPQTEESYQSPVWETFDGRVMAAVRSTGQVGTVKVRFSAPGCEEAEITLTSN